MRIDLSFKENHTELYFVAQKTIKMSFYLGKTMASVCPKRPFLFKPFVPFWMSMTFNPGVDSTVHWGSVMKYFKGNCSGLKLVRSKRMQTNKSYYYRTKQPQNLVLYEMQSSEMWETIY